MNVVVNAAREKCVLSKDNASLSNGVRSCCAHLLLVKRCSMPQLLGGNVSDVLLLLSFVIPELFCVM